MKTRSRGSWLVLTLVALCLSAAAFFGGEKQAEAVSGDWGIVRQAYLYDECIYAVFVANQLDVTITGVGVRAQFADSYGGSLGTYNLVGDSFIEPWTTDVLGWRIPAICKTVESARILKSVAAY
jgi:hypothetical protein